MPSFSRRVVSDQAYNAPPFAASNVATDQENPWGLPFRMNSISQKCTLVAFKIKKVHCALALQTANVIVVDSTVDLERLLTHDAK